MTGRKSAGNRVSARESPSNDSRPTKRSRVTRACDQCRANREKCCGSQPKCKTCTSQERPCSYNEAPKKRGIQPNYIRTLELTLAWVFQSFPQAEIKLSSSLPDPNGLTQQLLNGKEVVASEALHQYWRNSIVNSQIDQMLSGAQVESASNEAMLREQDVLNQSSAQAHTPDLSLSGDHDDLTSITAAMQNATPSTSHLTTRKASLDEIDLEINSGQEPLIQLPANALTLIEYYFAFTQPWVPMIQKHSILKLMYSYGSAKLMRGQLLTADHAELWSILAVASSQMSWEMDASEIARIRNITESFLPKSHNYEVPHIKAMILLSLIDIQSDQLLAAWLRLGAVIRVLTLLRLVQNLGSTDKWCRHVHLVAFVIENALARRLSALPHLTVSYIANIGFLAEDGMDEWNPWIDPLANIAHGVSKSPSKAFSTLNELVRRAIATTTASSEAQDFGTNNLDYDNILFDLLHNACSQHNRIQPSKLVDVGKKDLPPLAIMFPSKSVHSPTTAGTLHATHPGPNLQQSLVAVPDSDRQSQIYSSSEQDTDLNQQSSRGFSDAVQKLLLDALSPGSNIETTQPRGDSAVDIFEELASLEQPEHTQSSKFMQNLGFAPDIDLAEFFGADYQPSDPFLTYLLPTPHRTGMS